MTVEFLLAWEDGTWTTVNAEVPRPDGASESWDFLLRKWGESNLLAQARYRKVVMLAVYAIHE